MANKLYAKARRKFARGEIKWKPAAEGGDAFRVLLVDGAQYTPDLAADEFLTAIPEAARKGNNGSSARADFPLLTVADLPDGVCDAEDFIIENVPAGEALEFLVIIRDGGSDAASELVHFGDSHTGLPIAPNGANITMAWDNGANRIFKL